VIDSPVGQLLIKATNGSLVELSFRHRIYIGNQTSNDGDKSSVDVLDAVEAQIAEYFARVRSRFALPLDQRGPEFHQRVWEALVTIPYGKTISYGQLAENLGCPGAARAVGLANGANPIAIIVPCHRVIGADGSLVGYGGGLNRKRMLLDLESGRVPLELSPSP
jgi:methylated-DNA-[protein]-cysteine S-methyltransferase